MKQSVIHILLMVSLISFSQCCAQKNAKSEVFKSVKIMYTEAYCGGAAPPDELIAELSTPKVYANQAVEIYVSNTLEGKKMFLKTDQNGMLSLPTSFGETLYLSIYPFTNAPENTKGEDRSYAECYKKHVIKSLKALNVTNSDQILNISVEKDCDPCLPPAP